MTQINGMVLHQSGLRVFISSMSWVTATNALMLLQLFTVLVSGPHTLTSFLLFLNTDVHPSLSPLSFSYISLSFCMAKVRWSQHRMHFFSFENLSWLHNKILNSSTTDV